eukprot:TRINITY_DN5027_c0_g1_i2.p1 TRINITY_DN5027_c0_g1~~TRINITY_DN5027_c0_g1_i2.p1  ORF type:complete len:797 (-),score=180.16 TRINITY_DN5027_c0_g1_i2:7-2397(-)
MNINKDEDHIPLLGTALYQAPLSRGIYSPHLSRFILFFLFVVSFVDGFFATLFFLGDAKFEEFPDETTYMTHETKDYTFRTSFIDLYAVIMARNVLLFAYFIVELKFRSNNDIFYTFTTSAARRLRFTIAVIILLFASWVFSIVKISLVTIVPFVQYYQHTGSHPVLSQFYYAFMGCCFGLGTLQLFLLSRFYVNLNTLRTSFASKDDDGVLGDDEAKKGKHATVMRLVKLARPEVYLLSAGMVALLISSGSTLAMPMFFGQIIEAVSVTKSSEELNQAILALFIIFLIGSIATFVRSWLFTLAGQRLVARVRVMLFKAMTRQEVAFFDTTNTGELVNRLASDTQVIQNTLTVNISMGVRYVVQIFGSIVLLFVTSWSLTLIMLGVVPVVAIGAVVYGKRLKTLSKDFQDQLAKSSSTGGEALGAIRTVRSFAQEVQLQEAYAKEVDLSYLIGSKMALAGASFAGILFLAAQASIAFVILIGARQVLHNQITIGALTSFLMYTISLAVAFAFVSSLFADFMSAVGASERIFELLDRKPTINFEAGDVLPKVEGHLELHNVTFAYPSRPESNVLSNFSLSIEPGQVVALVGPSGGGKSTTVSLIERFYDPQSGYISLDGHAIQRLDPKWYRGQIGFVSQEPVLFARSIKDNITFGMENATMEQVIAAATQANAHQFISDFPEGYDAMVGERGVRLSGGQKQRIAIARALLLNPQILLLDEATSALDAESEHLVQQAIDNIMQGRTTLVIAHRLSTVRNAHKVVVVSGGRIVESGTHDELLQGDGIYKKLVKRQLQRD